LLKGLPSHTPVALIQDASLPTQRQVVTTLQNLHQSLVDEQLASPCVIVVGDVLLERKIGQLNETFAKSARN